MKKVVAWLTGVEKTAEELYRDAARLFASDPPFAEFLKTLSEEESWHFRILSAAASGMDGEHLERGAVRIDALTRERISERLALARKKVAKGEITREEMLEVIVQTEFSEWNDIFLYVLDTLAGLGREYQRAAAEIESHREEIGRFLRTLPEGARFAESIKSLPPVWSKRILVVEDEASVARLLGQVLRAEGAVELAANGREGLEKVRRGYFDVIVSDMEMPVMNGIDFYLEACKVEPDIGERFLFFTAATKKENEDFFSRHHLSRMMKPAPIHRIREAVASLARLTRTLH